MLVTTLTKKMAEDLTDYLVEVGIRVRYMHAEVDTIQRIEIVRDLRLGEFDVLVGINLLREGLDLPEVSLVAILDADKEGFLRSETSLDPDDRPGGPQRRRHVLDVRRQRHRLDARRDRRDPAPPPDPARVQPRARHRPADDPQAGDRHPAVPARRGGGGRLAPRRNAGWRCPATSPTEELGRLIQGLEEEMHQAAKELRFEYAARLRDEVHELRKELRQLKEAGVA